MKNFNPQDKIPPRILASDLDGTLIPLPEEPENTEALDTLRQQREIKDFGLIYATGRHFESVVKAIDTHGLPVPDWIVCDVGTSIHQRSGNNFTLFDPYYRHLNEITEGVDRRFVERLLDDIENLRLQAPEHQKTFKISYQSAPDAVDHLTETINARLHEAGLPYNCTGSTDPFLDCGLFDVLPSNVSKAYALIWLATHADFTPDEVVYAGDSGNDLAALVSGFRAILVANSGPDLVKQAREQLRSRKLESRLYAASRAGTSGVLEGCRYYGLVPAE
ncbi:MAG: HAD-IIB family hydrolase [Opitutales bacterium]